MSKFFLYNGVKLPALPEWDQNRFPYAFIYAFGTNDNGTVSEVCTLVVSASNQMVYDNIGIGFRYNDIGIGKTISADEAQWVDWTWNSGGSEYFYVKRDEPTDILYIRVVWANFDVLNANGSVYVAASDPVPVAGKFPLQGWLNWHVAGLCSRPLPVSVREPVAYLYNGVRLPGLPETNYQYAVMFETTEELVYQLYFTIEPPTATDSVLYPVKIEPPYTHYSYNAADTPMWEWQGSGETALEVSVFDYAHWANCDIFDNAGSVFLAASDPVPVYE